MKFKITKIAIFLLLTLVAIFYMESFTKKPKIIETRTFSCEGMRGFIFEYPVFEGWDRVESSKAENMACALTYYYTGVPKKFRQPSIEIPILYIAYHGESGQSAPPEFNKINPHKVNYEKTEEGYEFWIDNQLIGAIRIIVLNNHLESGFPRDLFFQTMIESFRVLKK